MLSLPLQISIQTPWQRVSMMMKSCWIIHLFFDGIFSKLFFFPRQSNSLISASCLPFPPHFELCCIFWETFHHRSVQLLLPSCFYIPPPVIHREWCWVSATTCCVQREVIVVCMRTVCLCVHIWKCVRRGGGYWRSGFRGDWAGWAKFWWEKGGSKRQLKAENL